MQKPRRIQSAHVEKLDSELCVYDWQRKEVHNLNPTAALVWELCDGQTTPQQMTQRLQAASELDGAQAEDVVWMTLEELEQAHLLESEVVQPTGGSLMTRRTLLKQMGVAAALLPVVATIVAPGPVQAQTPGGACDPNPPGSATNGTWQRTNQGCTGPGFFDDEILNNAEVVEDVLDLCPCNGRYVIVNDVSITNCTDCFTVAVTRNADFYRYGQQNVIIDDANFDCILIYCNDDEDPPVAPM